MSTKRTPLNQQTPPPATMTAAPANNEQSGTGSNYGAGYNNEYPTAQTGGETSAQDLYSILNSTNEFADEAVDELIEFAKKIPESQLTTAKFNEWLAKTQKAAASSAGHAKQVKKLDKLVKQYHKQIIQLNGKLKELNGVSEYLDVAGKLFQAVAIWEINAQFAEFEKTQHKYSDEQQVQMVSNMMEDAILVFNPTGFILGLNEYLKEKIPGEEWLASGISWIRENDKVMYALKNLASLKTDEWKKLFFSETWTMPSSSVQSKLTPPIPANVYTPRQCVDPKAPTPYASNKGITEDLIATIKTYKPRQL